MQAQSNFNRRTAPVIDVESQVQRTKIHCQEPIVVTLRSLGSRSKLQVTMTPSEALALAAELYAITDKGD